MSETKSGLGRRLSESESEQAWASLRTDFAEISRWQDEGISSVEAKPGSLLGIVDAMTEPFQASHHVGYLLHTAVDHLHGLKMLMDQTGAQHTFAPYTLVRAAVESASTALWILQPEAPREVARRSLRLEFADLNDLKRANTTDDPDAGHDEVRLGTFDSCLSRHGWKNQEAKERPPGPLVIIQEVSEHFDVFGAALMWQICSAAAHGKRWARQYLTLFEFDDDGTSKVLSGRLTSDESAIAMAVHIACDMVGKAKAVRGIHSKDPLHSGASFIRRKPACKSSSRDFSFHADW
ncbi:hypothetical protein [Arthrobacter sp. Leaf141]|uniref:hypothetical protein n=1 Tax=Arthrobacter sp. Leaf141 TaxID=1736273 RepID=UPI0012FCAD38|nr:hypothetical protein [Arthrobacter sp. Leaf141]